MLFLCWRTVCDCVKAALPPRAYRGRTVAAGSAIESSSRLAQMWLVLLLVALRCGFKAESDRSPLRKRTLMGRQDCPENITMGR